MKSNVHYVFTKAQQINSFQTSYLNPYEYHLIYIKLSRLVLSFVVFRQIMCTHSLTTRSTCHALFFSRKRADNTMIDRGFLKWN